MTLAIFGSSVVISQMRRTFLSLSLSFFPTVRSRRCERSRFPICGFRGELERETRRGSWAKNTNEADEGRERRDKVGSIDEGTGTLELFVKGRQRRLIDVSMELP